MSLTRQRSTAAVAAVILLAAAFLSSCGGGGTSGVNVPSAGSLTLPAFWLADSFSADADKAAVSARVSGLDAAYSSMDVNGYMPYISATYADAENPSYNDLQAAIQGNFGFFETIRQDFWNTDIFVDGNTAWVQGYMIYSGR